MNSPRNLVLLVTLVFTIGIGLLLYATAELSAQSSVAITPTLCTTESPSVTSSTASMSIVQDEADAVSSLPNNWHVITPADLAIEATDVQTDTQPVTACGASS